MTPPAGPGPAKGAAVLPARAVRQPTGGLDEAICFAVLAGAQVEEAVLGTLAQRVDVDRGLPDGARCGRGLCDRRRGDFRRRRIGRRGGSGGFVPWGDQERASGGGHLALLAIGDLGQRHHHDVVRGHQRGEGHAVFGQRAQQGAGERVRGHVEPGRPGVGPEGGDGGGFAKRVFGRFLILSFAPAVARCEPPPKRCLQSTRHEPRRTRMTGTAGSTCRSPMTLRETAVAPELRCVKRWAFTPTQNRHKTS